jgi:hypothetical protein
MRTFARFLSLLLCLELIVGPIAPKLSLVALNAHASDCGPGLTYDNSLNRCLTKTEIANVLNSTANCNGDKECYKQNAQLALTKGGAPDRVDDGKLDTAISKVAGIAAVAGAVTYAVTALKDTKSRCKSPAFYGMIGGALALVVGDNLANMQHAKRLKEIEKDWGNIVNPVQAQGDKDKERQTSIEAQSEAFEMLARSEDSLAQAAKMKHKFFMVASVAFGVTAAISGYEIIHNRSLRTLALTTSKTAVTASAAAAGLALTPPDPAVASLVLVQNAAAATANASGKKDALDADKNASDQDKNELNYVSDTALKQKAYAVETSIKSATLAWDAAAKAMTASKAFSTVEAASKATKSWEEHTRVTTCEDSSKNVNEPSKKIPGGDKPKLYDNPMDIQGPSINPPESMDVYLQNNRQGIYSYYLNPPNTDIKAELQSLYNLKHSTDITSFVMNKWEMDGVLVTPVDDYLAYKETLKDIGPDQSVFEAFKEISLAFIDLMNPVSSVYANEQLGKIMGSVEASKAVVNSVSGNNSSTSTPAGNTTASQPESNAAKTYKEIKAMGIDYVSVIGGVVAGGALAYSGIGKKLLTSKGRLIFSGILALLTLKMSLHASDQAKASEMRAQMLRKMKGEFNTTSGAIYACKSEDRNDPAKPNCYCYTADNQRNSGRGNSQVCQKLWAGTNTKAGNYTSNQQSNRVCVTQNRKSDPTCTCKKTNSCMKVGLSGIEGLGQSSMSIMGNGFAPMNKIMDGSIDGANLDTATLGSQAAKIAELNKALEKNPEVAKAKNSKEALVLQKELEKGGTSLGRGGLLGVSTSSNLPSNPAAAAKMLEKELNQATLPTGISKADEYVSDPSSGQENLEFGGVDDQASTPEVQISEVMNQDVDFGNHDINKGSSTNIFEVLSNRYKRSGIKRLFDEKSDAKPEAPAATDITN